MRAFQWLLIVLATLVVGVLGVGLALPDSAHIERQIVIDAPPSRIYAVLDSFRQYEQWTPWPVRGTDAKVLYDGPDHGVGARMTVLGGAGERSQEIVDTEPDRRVVIRQTFGESGADNRSTFSLVAEGEGTRLTWAYDSRFNGNLLSRYFGLLLEPMVGADYAKGLLRLKTLVEAEPASDASPSPAQASTP